VTRNEGSVEPAAGPGRSWAVLGERGAAAGQVDAALDLSHTQNIGRMIRSHFPYSQFIVVSLKEGMFSNANVLFRTKFVDGVSAVTRTVTARRCAAPALPVRASCTSQSMPFWPAGTMGRLCRTCGGASGVFAPCSCALSG